MVATPLTAAEGRPLSPAWGYRFLAVGALAVVGKLVLPYDVARYRWRGSGILAQCMAAGVPVALGV